MGQVNGQGSASEFNGDVSNLVHRAEAQLHRLQPDTGSQSDGASNLNSIVQRISGTSVMEIERLIAELHTLRDYLLREGQRVQREITQYAQMSQAATKSTKIIAESLAWLKANSEPNRGPRS
jgi:hypothetical protein